MLVKALKWPPSQLFPGTWIVISFYVFVANHVFLNVALMQGVYVVFASKQMRHYFDVFAMDMKFRVVLVTFIEERICGGVVALWLVRLPPYRVAWVRALVRDTVLSVLGKSHYSLSASLHAGM